MSGCWVFGYGSLVSPASFGATLGRVLRPGVDFFEAELSGFGRRWNYGALHTKGASAEPDGTTRDWTIVALGLVAAAHLVAPTHDQIEEIPDPVLEDQQLVAALVQVPAGNLQCPP